MLRNYLVFQHRWTGLLMTAFLAVVGLTGSILALRPQLDRVINPELHAHPLPGQKLLDLATLAEKAEAILGSKERIGHFWLEPISDPERVIFHCHPQTDPKTGKEYENCFYVLYLNPYTGEELGRDQGPGIPARFRWRDEVLSIHSDCFMGGFGYTVVGYVALIWTIDCFVGFYLTLPLGLSGFLRRWKPAWWVKWNSSPLRINYDLHRASGLWLWPLLFIFAWSGVMFNLHSTYEKVMGKLTPYVLDEEEYKPNHPPHVSEPHKLSWRQILPICERLADEQAKLHGFKLDRPLGMANGDYYDYAFRTQGDLGANTWQSDIWVDGDTGELLRADYPGSLPLGDQISVWLYALHFADFHNYLWYRILVFLLGLMIVGLSVTGVYIWWKKRETKVRAKRRVVAP